MSKKIRFYGPKSLNRARRYIDQHPDRDLVLLKDSRTRRFAVCSPNMAQKLSAQGFSPVQSED
jgi:hypothetical protein